MRVTQRSVSRNYMRNLNNTLAKRASAFERGTTGAAFDRLSQNVAAAGGSYVHRKKILFHNVPFLNRPCAYFTLKTAKK